MSATPLNGPIACAASLCRQLESRRMFDLFLRPYVPGFRVKPQDGGPGFDVDENGGLPPGSG